MTWLFDIPGSFPRYRGLLAELLHRPALGPDRSNGNGVTSDSQDRFRTLPRASRSYQPKHREQVDRVRSPVVSLVISRSQAIFHDQLPGFGATHVVTGRLPHV